MDGEPRPADPQSPPFLGSILSPCLPLRLTGSGMVREEKEEGMGPSRWPEPGRSWANPEPSQHLAAAPPQPSDLLTQGLQCEQLRPGGEQKLLTEARRRADGELGTHSNHSRILTFPEHSTRCHSFGPLSVLPSQTEMSFDANSLLSWG